MTDTMIIEAVGFIVAMIAVITPIVRLNSNIVSLNATLTQIREEQKKDFANHDKRLEKHGEQIDDLEKTVVNHDTRINALERER